VMVTAKTSLVSVGINARMVTRILAPYANLRVVRVLRKRSCSVSIVVRVRHDLAKTVKTLPVFVGISAERVTRI